MPVDGLLRELLDARQEIAFRVIDRVRGEMPSFDAVPREEHLESIASAIEILISTRLGGAEVPPSAAPTALREMGERRARQGVPVDDLLRSWRIGIEEATAYAREIAPRTDAKQVELFDLFQEAFGIADQAMVSVAGGHRREPGPGDSEAERRGALVRGAISGRFSAEELHSGLVALEMDPLVPYLAFRARDGEISELDDLDAALELDPASSRRVGVVATIESELAGFSSQLPRRGALPLIAVGPAVPIVELTSSYRAAGRVLAAAETFGLVGLHDLTSAGLHAGVIEDADLGDALVELLIEPLRGHPGGEDVLASVREWLACGMRIEPAAERLFVHPNTVRYRLRRYQELTGAELAETEDAFRVWWALQRDLAVGPGE